MSKSKQKKKTLAEWHEQNKKKLNYFKSLGFNVGLAERQEGEWRKIDQSFDIEAILNNMENEGQYNATIYAENNLIVCYLDKLDYKMLDYKTLLL